MNKDEIQKLIGGYATGSLTDEERRSLFEAALDDQELFDALQNEQALKELFDDPVSREQVRRAAAESLPSPKRAWFRNKWMWGAGVSVAAAAVLLVVLLQPSQQHNAAYVTPQKQIAASPPPPQLDAKKSEPATPVRESVQRARPAKPVNPVSTPAEPVDKVEKEEPRALVPPPSPPPAAIQTSQVSSGPSQASATQSQSVEVKDLATEKAPVSAETASSPVTGFRAQQKTLAAPAMGRMAAPAPARTIYSLARRLENGSYLDAPVDTVFQPGEIIRLTIFARAAGPLTIMEWDADNSQWNRIFPLEGETVQAPALENYAVPRDITVKPGERLRVTVGPVSNEIAIRTTTAR